MAGKREREKARRRRNTRGNAVRSKRGREDIRKEGEKNGFNGLRQMSCRVFQDTFKNMGICSDRK